MFRFALLMLLSTSVYALQPVDIETAATVYQDAAIREQVRASLGSMPEHIRQLFSADAAAHLSDQQLKAITAAAKRGFRIDVFEVPALSALAANLDADTVKKSEEFLSSDLGRRMVAADVATSALPEDQINKIMNGEQSAPSTPQRDALLDKLERASRSTESTVQIFLSMGQAVAVGTAVGAGGDMATVADKARKSGEATRADMEASMREPLRRYLAYGYRVHELGCRSEAFVEIFGVPAGQGLCVCLHRLLRRGVRRHGQALRRAIGREPARAGAGATGRAHRRAAPPGHCGAAPVPPSRTP